MTLQLNLDTRRDAFGLTVDLNEAEALIPLVVFDAPDELRQPARLSLVSLEARASHRAAGWASGGALSEEITLEPRGQATLAISRDWLAERVALMRHRALRKRWWSSRSRRSCTCRVRRRPRSGESGASA